jgi:hypothetical protein
VSEPLTLQAFGYSYLSREYKSKGIFCFVFATVLLALLHLNLNVNGVADDYQ